MELTQQRIQILEAIAQNRCGSAAVHRELAKLQAEEEALLATLIEISARLRMAEIEQLKEASKLPAES